MNQWLSAGQQLKNVGVVAKRKILRHMTSGLKDQPLGTEQQKELHLPSVQLHLDIISHITKANAYKSTANRESSKLDVTPSRTSGDI